MNSFNVAFGWVASWLSSIHLLIHAPRCGFWRPLASPPLSPAAPTLPRLGRSLLRPLLGLGAASLGVDRAPVGAIASAPERARRSSPVRCRRPPPAAPPPRSPRLRRRHCRHARPAAAIGAPRAARRSLSPRARRPIARHPLRRAPRRPAARQRLHSLQVQPGSRLVIPVFRAGGARGRRRAAPASCERGGARPVAAKPWRPASPKTEAEPAEPKRAAVKTTAEAAGRKAGRGESRSETRKGRTRHAPRRPVETRRQRPEAKR